MQCSAWAEAEWSCGLGAGDYREHYRSAFSEQSGQLAHPSRWIVDRGAPKFGRFWLRRWRPPGCTLTNGTLALAGWSQGDWMSGWNLEGAVSVEPACTEPLVC